MNFLRREIKALALERIASWMKGDITNTKKINSLFILVKNCSYGNDKAIARYWRQSFRGKHYFAREKEQK